MAPRWPGPALLTTKAPRKLVFLFTLSLSITYLFYSLLSCYSSLQFPLQEAGIYLQPESQITIRTASLKPDPESRDQTRESLFPPFREPGAVPLSGSSASISPSLRSIQNQAASFLSTSTSDSSSQPGSPSPTVRTGAFISEELRSRSSPSTELLRSTHAGSTAESVSSLDRTPYRAPGRGFSTLDSAAAVEDKGEVDSAPIVPANKATADPIVSDDQGYNILDRAANKGRVWKFNSLDSAVIKTDYRFNSLDSPPIEDTDHRLSSLDRTPVQDTDHRFNSLDSQSIKDTENPFNSLDKATIKDTDHRFNSLDTVKDTENPFKSLDKASIKDTDRRLNSLDSPFIKDTKSLFNSLDKASIKVTVHRFNSLDSSPIKDTEWQFTSLDGVPLKDIKDSDLQFNSKEDALVKVTGQRFNSLDRVAIKDIDHRVSSLDSTDQLPNSLAITPIKDTDHRFNSFHTSVVKDTDPQFKSLRSADKGPNSLGKIPVKDTGPRLNSLDSANQQFNSFEITPIKDTDYRFNSLAGTDQKFDSLDSTPIEDTELRVNSLHSSAIKGTDLQFNFKESSPIKDTAQRFSSLGSVLVKDTDQHFNSLYSAGEQFSSLDRAPVKDADQRFISLYSAPVKQPIGRFSTSGSASSLSISRTIGASIIANNQGFGAALRDPDSNFNTVDIDTGLNTIQTVNDLDSAPVIASNPGTSGSIHQRYRTSDSNTDRRSRTSDNAPLEYTDQTYSPWNRSPIQPAYKGITSSDTVSNKSTIPSTAQRNITPNQDPIQPTDLRLSTSDHSPKAPPLPWELGKNEDGGQTTPSFIWAIPLSNFSTAGSVSFSGPEQKYQHIADTSSGEVRGASGFIGDEMRFPLREMPDWEKTPLAATEMIPSSHTGYLEREAQESSTTDEELSHRISINSTAEYGDKRLPQAIIIGVKKGGTRALLEALRAHPDVRAVGVEPHFFDRNYEKGLEWYRDLMPRTIEGQITMEKTPSYFVTNDAPQRIHSMAKDTKLIVVVRNPVTRAISDYTQTLSKKPEIPTFEVLAFKNRTLGLIDASWSALRIGIYALHLESWMQYFPLSQILLVSGERLITHPAEELAKVQEFLGLQRIITEKYFHFNKTKGFPCLKKPEDIGAPRCLGKSKGRTHPKIDPEVIQRLRKFYKPFNAMFYQMTGQDFQWEKEELEG